MFFVQSISVSFSLVAELTSSPAIFCLFLASTIIWGQNIYNFKRKNGKNLENILKLEYSRNILKDLQNKSIDY